MNPNTLDLESAGQLADRLKSLFESARRFRARRRLAFLRTIRSPRSLPQEAQLELGLQLER